jgi:hypothetical protein
MASAEKVLKNVLDDATYNLSVLSDDSIRPPLLAELESRVSSASAAMARAGRAPQALALLASRRDDVAPSQYGNWHGIVDRVSAALRSTLPPPPSPA